MFRKSLNLLLLNLQKYLREHAPYIYQNIYSLIKIFCNKRVETFDIFQLEKD